MLLGDEMSGALRHPARLASIFRRLLMRDPLRSDYPLPTIPLHMETALSPKPSLPMRLIVLAIWLVPVGLG